MGEEKEVIAVPGFTKEQNEAYTEEMNKGEKKEGSQAAAQTKPEEKPAEKAEGQEATPEEKPTEAKPEEKAQTQEKPAEDKAKPATSPTDEDKALLKQYGLENETVSPAMLAALKRSDAEAKKNATLATQRENDARRYAAQNHELSKLYKAAKEAQTQKPDEAKESVKAALSKIDKSKLPQNVQELLADEDYIAATTLIAQQILTDSKAGKAEPEAPAMPDMTGTSSAVDPEAAKAAALQEVERTTKAIKDAGFPEFENTYKDAEFHAYMKDRIDQERKINLELENQLIAQYGAPRSNADAVQLLKLVSPTYANFMTPNAAAHIGLLRDFKTFKTAKEEAEAKRKEEQERNSALHSHGEGGRGGGRSGGGDKSPLDMTDEEFREYDQKVRSGAFSK